MRNGMQEKRVWSNKVQHVVEIKKLNVWTH